MKRTKTQARLAIMKQKCGSCPFRVGSEYADLAGHLAQSGLSEASRICHSTGSNGLKGRTGKPPKICRGNRDVQLQTFVALGFLSAPTDAAWDTKCKEMGL